MSSRLALATALLLVSAGVLGQWYDPRSGERRPDAPDRKSDGPLGAMVALTTKPQEFLAEWYGTPHQHVPELMSSESVNRGESIAVLVFFSGCAPQGTPCDAVVDFKVMKPDGSVYGEHAGVQAWPHLSAPETSVVLSQAHLLAAIEPHDPLGMYKVFATFKVPSAGRTLVLETSFSVPR
jgi:hypothetical protein